MKDEHIPLVIFGSVGGLIALGILATRPMFNAQVRLANAFVKNKKAFNQNNERHLFHFNPVNLTEFFLKLGLFNIDLSYPYYETPYKNLKRDFKETKKLKFIKKSPPGVGNMMSMVFKKLGS